VLKIIGFEYICNLHNIAYVEIANLLDISKQTVNSWTAGRRKIPTKYLPVLSKKFNIPESFFQKEIDTFDQVKIQKYKLENEINRIDSNEYEEKLFNLEQDYSDVIVVESIKKIIESFKDISFNEFEVKVSMLANFSEIIKNKDDVVSRLIQSTIYNLVLYCDPKYQEPYEKDLDEEEVIENKKLKETILNHIEYESKYAKSQDMYKVALYNLLKKKESDIKEYLEAREDDFNRMGNKKE